MPIVILDEQPERVDEGAQESGEGERLAHQTSAASTKGDMKACAAVLGLQIRSKDSTLGVPLSHFNLRPTVVYY
jgi:hypothetical protein